jgi:hypothetical protein
MSREDHTLVGKREQLGANGVEKLRGGTTLYIGIYVYD